jgi:TolB-like protein
MNDKMVGTLCFDVFELDLRTRELRRKSKKIRVQEQPIQLLAMLLEHPGELLTREEIRKKLWPDDTFVDFDHGLNTAVNKLRTALGDSADNPRFIETLPRKGYRFIGQVSKPVRSIIAVEKTKVGKIRLAVLPLKDYSDRGRDEYFSDGLTDELITQLSRLEPDRLGVIALTSTSRYKNTQMSIREIGHELDADYVLEGSVLRSGERVRINAQLIDTKDETHVWAESFDHDLGDIFLLQDKVSRSVASSISIKLSPGNRALYARPYHVDPDAYDAYLQGRFYWLKMSGYGWTKACSYFEMANEKDPGYGAPYSGLADCYLKQGQYGFRPPKEAFPQAREAALKALTIDTTLAEAHGSLALILCLYDWDWKGAEHEFCSSLTYGPQSGVLHAWYSWFLLAMGRSKESLRQAQLALVLEPFGNITNSMMGWHCIVKRDYGLADVYLRKAIEIEPDSFVSYMLLGMVRAAESRIEEAITLINKHNQLLGTNNGTGILAAVCARSGQHDKILRLQEDLTRKSKETFVPASLFAILAMAMGELEQTFEWLDKAYEERDSGLVTLKCNPIFQHIYSNSRFQTFLSRMNFPA